MATSSSSSDAFLRFVAENGIETLSPDDALYYRYDKPQQQQMLSERKWKENPNHFTRIRISAVALIKMVMHARSGGALEVMGLMQGKLMPDNTMVVMDCFALPVEGTETRVNAQNEAYEYMVDYIGKSKQVGRLENVLGWYHSHPGYGCWLSGIDVSTQKLNQQYQEPFVALVIDPNRTISAGKVEIGAFRTYPEGHVPKDDSSSKYQSIPLDKIEDFGVHAKEYYPLEISFFKSSLDTKLLDLLWNKYWISTLSSSALITNLQYNSNQILDLSAKISQAESTLTQHGRLVTSFNPSASGKKSKSGGGGGDDGGGGVLGKVVTDGCKIAAECRHALMTQVVKQALFNSR